MKNQDSVYDDHRFGHDHEVFEFSFVGDEVVDRDFGSRTVLQIRECPGEAYEVNGVGMIEVDRSAIAVEARRLIEIERVLINNFTACNTYSVLKRAGKIRFVGTAAAGNADQIRLISFDRACHRRLQGPARDSRVHSPLFRPLE